jgi:SAM-dependent methyltransferase
MSAVQPAPAFASDAATAAYYERRAAEYDEWYRSEGLFAGRDRPGWDDEVRELQGVISRLDPARSVDVACGTGFLTRHLPGTVVGLDRSFSMLKLAGAGAPGGAVVLGDALSTPFADGAFERLFTAHFYGHLPAHERSVFAAEAARVARELVVVDSALRPGVEPEMWQERVLNDGSRHRVYKRYLTGRQLAGEIGGEVLMEGRWFVAARSHLRGGRP